MPAGATLSIDGRAVNVGKDGLFIEWWPLKLGKHSLKLVQTYRGKKEVKLLSLTRLAAVLPAKPTRVLSGSLEPSGAVEYWDWAGEAASERLLPVRFRASVGGKAVGTLAGRYFPITEIEAGYYGADIDLSDIPVGKYALNIELRGQDGKKVALAAVPVRLSHGETRTMAQKLGSVQGVGVREATSVIVTESGERIYPREGMKFMVVGRRGDWLRLRLPLPDGTALTAWARASQLQSQLQPVSAVNIASGREEMTRLHALLTEQDSWEWRIAGAAGQAFSLSQPSPDALRLTLYSEVLPRLPEPDTLLTEAAGERDIILHFSRSLVGWSAVYDAGDLVIRARPLPVLAAERVRPLEGLKVTLDAGHGGRETGGAGAFGIPEKDIVLPITLRAAELLREAGATVFLTREKDTTLGLYDRVLFAEKNASHLLLSVHANALPDGVDPRQYRGTEIYFSHEGAREISVAVLRALQERLPELGKGRGLIGGANLALTRPSSVTSALIELAYLTDPDNLRVLMSEGGRERMAQAIADGVQAWAAQVLQ